MEQAHGNAVIRVEGKVVILLIRGSWNLAGYLEFVAQFKEAAKPLIAQKWGVITDIREWELSTPEVDAASEELQLWTLENNQRWRAFVSDESFLKKLQISRSAEPIGTAIEQRYFPTMEGAREWFQKLGLFDPPKKT